MSNIDTTVKQIAEKATADLEREYRMSAKNSAMTYIKLARKIHASGISQVRALEIINSNFKGEAKAFLDAQARGEKLPILFPKPGPSYEEKRKLALSRGGII